MTVDLHGSDPVATRASHEYVEELLSWARARLGGAAEPVWSLVSVRSKMTKTIFEADAGGRALIGKVSQSERSAQTWEKMKSLWDAGMRPPSLYQVSEPVAWFAERKLLLQGKAQGAMLLELIRTRNPRALDGAVAAGGWLRALQSLRISQEPAPDYAPVIQRCAAELSHALPGYTRRLEQAAASLLEQLPASYALLPSHGDFHPMNVFLDDAGGLTAIDLDTAGGREAAVDIAYFAAQLAIMGCLVFGDLDATRALRAAFRESAPAVPADRVDLHTRITFLRTLHYDLCILKLNDHSKVEPFVAVLEQGLPV